jgi:tripartite ATP-independent transporter DctM subunit
MITSLLIIFVVLVFLRFEIALAIGIAVALSIAFFSDLSLAVLVQRLVVGIDSFVFLAIPLFVLAGNMMNAGGITDRIFSFARALIGHFRGGLGHANVVASMIFAGMSGSAVADAGGLGAIEIKAMDDQGYPREFSAAITVASSVVGPVIPPSIPMVLYGALAEVSVGRLFLGGILPGILVGISLMILVYFFSLRYDYPRDARVSLKEFLRRFIRAVFPILTPVIILGGIVGGVFTPTEAAAVAVFYAFVLSFFLYKTLTLRDLPDIFVKSMVTTAITTFVMSTTSSFSYILLIGNFSQGVIELLTSITVSKYLMLFILNILLLFFGCVMEAGVALILLVPILVPVLNAVGIDLVHFGVVMTLNLMIGVATPPVGMCLFVVSHVANVRIERLMRVIIPFLFPPILVLFFITYVPGIVTFIPNLVFGK